LAIRRQAFGQDSATFGVELGENVVEKQQRWHAAPFPNQLRLGEQQSQNSKSLLALRPEGAEVTRAGEDLDIVEVRPGAGGAAVQIAVETSFERLHRWRVGFVAKPGIRKPQLAGVCRE